MELLISISCHQYGFCKNKSTLQQLLLYFGDLSSDRRQTDSIYLDFSKALDSISHTLLLLKLRSAGIIGGMWSWLHSYLSSCSQCVLVNNCLFEPLPVKSGVPQGSILDPLLFIVYVNDLSRRVKNSTIIIFKFADNLCNTLKQSILSLTANCDLNSLHGWSLDNLLSFSIKKCVVLHFKANSSMTTNYSINGVELTNITKYRDLGIKFVMHRLTILKQ